MSQLEAIENEKSDDYSDKSREKGNEAFRQGEITKSLTLYNESLGLARTSSRLALAYGNRSAAFLCANKYQECLADITMARDHDFPAKKLKKLIDREAKCNRLLEAQKYFPKFNPWDFFRLSYPKNEKIPFLVNCLELKVNKQFGRYIVTNRDLKAGDIIGIENPFYKQLSQPYCRLRCRSCLASNNQCLIPCDGKCHLAMFCSLKCMVEAQAGFHQYECTRRLPDKIFFMQRQLTTAIKIAGSVAALQTLCKKVKKQTIFDFDLSRPRHPETQRNMLIASLAMAERPDKKGHFFKTAEDPYEDFVEKNFKHLTKSNDELKFLLAFMGRQRRVREANNIPYGAILQMPNRPTVVDISGHAICLFGGLPNYSCDPNIQLVAVDNKFIYYANRPIPAGSQLFMSYQLPFQSMPSRSERQKYLLENYNFTCECDACVNDYDMSRLPTKDESCIFPAAKFLDCPPEILIQDFKSICKYINENYHNYPCREIAELIAINFQNMQHIANKVVF